MSNNKKVTAIQSLNETKEIFKLLVEKDERMSELCNLGWATDRYDSAIIEHAIKHCMNAMGKAYATRFAMNIIKLAVRFQFNFAKWAKDCWFERKWMGTLAS